jgi:diguanylate cyclase (GGDEF)-like protein/PAS domain S-box-containing protein
MVLTLVLCSLGMGFGAPSLSSGSPALASLAQVRGRQTTGLNRPSQIHVLAVVTYYDSAGPNLFVQDATAGIWVDLRGLKAAPPQVGQLLDLRGTVGSGFSPYVANPEWKILGSAPLPNPARVSFEQAATGSADSQWVEMEGVVRSFVLEAEGSVLVIDAATPTGVFKVRVPDYHAPFPAEMVDAKVRFKGVCGAAFNRRNQLVAIHLMMPDMSYSKVVTSAPIDPFAVPIMPVNKIGSFSAQLTDIHRIKVLGTVTARFPGRGIFLMDATGGLYAETQDGAPVTQGDEVEVIGFPARGNYSSVLRSAGIRPTGKHSFIVPLPIDGRSALKGGYDAGLVTISGTVQAVNESHGSYSFGMQSDDRVNFAANFAVPVQSLPPLIGSRERLTGICSIKPDENGNPAEFAIVLRTPGDIVLLASPPWLTGRRAVFVLFALVILTALVFGWVVILRRRIRHQTGLIRARLKNEVMLEEKYRHIFERNLTGLYVANAEGEIVDCNEACALILGYPSREALLQNRLEAKLTILQFHQHFDESSSVEESQVRNAECRFQRGDGSWRWVLVNIRIANLADPSTTIFEAGLVDITDRKTAEDQVQYLAYYDSLTGLPNRSLLKDRLVNALAGALRRNEKVAILFLDLDRFKMINDSLGHSYGDLLLKEVAARLRGLARKEDTVARVGGDEFLVVLTAVKEAAYVANIAERIGREVEREFVILGHTFKVTCSIGISIFPEHGLDEEALIKNADAAMYCAKDNGRYTYRFFTDDMNTEVVERLELENELRTALERGQFFVVYQPQIDLMTGRITGLESLLRWQHPRRGLVPPNKFIPVAENNGLIIPIGEWVLRTSCAQGRAWQDAGLHVPSIAVNVSAIQFRQKGFCDLVAAVLQDTGLPPECLELELTESLLLSSGETILSLLEELKKMGVKLAIDDFGTGYSSLSYLRQFPVDKIKIDGSFIKGVERNPGDAAITSAIIDMGRALNLKVLAECVETGAQMRFLETHRCDEIQGYYFSKPLTAVDAGEMLRLSRIEVGT